MPKPPANKPEQKVVLVRHVRTVPVRVKGGTLDSVTDIEGGTIDEVTNVSSVDLVDEVTNVSSVDLVDAVTEVANVTSVDTVDTVTEVANVSSVDLVDEVTNVSSVDTVDTLTSITNDVGVVQKVTDGGADVSIDSITNAQNTVDYPHHEIHSGRSYRVSIIETNTTSLNLAFKVGDQAREPHMVVRWRTEETAVMTIYEARTWTTSTGTDLTPVNANRTSANTSILEGDASGSFVANRVTQDVTGDAGGVTLFAEAVWATNQTPPSSGTERMEWVLDTDQTYLIDIVCGNGDVWLEIDWYEHSPA